MAVFLQPVVGWFTPPQRRARDPWVFEPLDSARPAEFVQAASIGSGVLDGFDGHDHVVGLYWNGSIVAVRLPHNRVVEVKSFEDRRWSRQSRAASV